MKYSSNVLSHEELEKIWIPCIVFENSENNDATKGDADSEIFITREGNFTRASDDIIEERNIFYGRENKLTFQQTLSKTFECEYQLQLYPFDTQVLKYLYLVSI